MPLRISYNPYRLLFKHPFGTAHGMRTGTDALFLKLEEAGVVGYGEITLPPYVKETVPESIERIKGIAALKDWTATGLLEELDRLAFLADAPGCRAGLHMALIDWLGKTSNRTAVQVLNAKHFAQSQTLMTIGICSLVEAQVRFAELPVTGCLKLKVGDSASMERVRWAAESTDSHILLDGNQGLRSVAEAAELSKAIRPERLIGFEQPFKVGYEALSLELAQRTGALVIADESLQDERDIGLMDRYFGGVNIKLMKCGGLDRAHTICAASRAMGLHVMLGSMSESSLGCTAMAQLAGEALVLDLDGPWLISNDPFVGLQLCGRTMMIPESPGLGAELVIEIDWIGV